MGTIPPELQVRLFGSFKLFQEGVERPLPASSHARTLLSYLFLNHKKNHYRLSLATLLSPESSETNARRLLNQALWHIRSKFPGLLFCQTDEIALAPDYPLVIDVVEFEQYILPYQAGIGKVQNAIRDLNRAIDLYQGDLLENVYDDWVYLERERLRELYFMALEHLIQTNKAAHEYQHALNVALRLAKGDPLRESNHRDIICLHHLLGNSSAAVKHYQDFQQLLQKELGMDPDPETQELLREISKRIGLHQTPYLPEPAIPAGQSLLEKGSPEELPLIGRSAEKRFILGWIEGVFFQRGNIVLIEGVPGIGKTRLLQDIQRDLEWRGAQVVLGKANPLQPTQAIDPLIQAITGGLSPLRIEQLRSLVSDERARLLEETLAILLGGTVSTDFLDPVLARNEQQGMRRGLSNILSLWSQAVPLVIILEDLHWAQEDTWEMLVDIAESIFTGAPVGLNILISTRPEESKARPWIHTALTRLVGTGLLSQIELHPLVQDASNQLIRTFLSIQQPIAPIETYLFQETGGNPLFILESLRLLYTQGRLNRQANVGELNSTWQFEPEAKLTGVPSLVEGMLTRRIENLSPHTVQVLQTLSVLGNSIDFGSLRGLCDLELNQLFVSLQELIQAHFLVETSQDYHFTHDLLLQVAYDSIPENRRKDLHARAGYLLESIHPELVEALAYHFEKGCAPERALYYHQKAGEAACQRNAYHQAAHHFNNAIGWAAQLDLTPVQQFDLYYRLESILDILGERDAQEQALETMDQLIQQNRPCTEIDQPDNSNVVDYQLQVLFRWANLHYAFGKYPQSEKVSREALSLAESCGDESARGKALLAIGSALHGAGYDKEAVPYLQSAIPHLHSTEEYRAESKVWQTLAVIYIDSSQCTLALEAIEAAKNLDQLLDDRTALTRDLIMTGLILFEQGEFERAENTCQQSLEISRSLGDRLNEAFALDILGCIFEERGMVGPALEMYARGIEICRALKEEKLRLSILLEQSDLLIFILGDFERAARSLNEAETLACSHSLARELACCSGSWAYIDLVQGNISLARSKLEQAVAQMQEQNCPKEEIWLRHLQVELELTDHYPAAALHFLQKAEILSQNLHIGNLHTQLLFDRSEVMLALGKPEEALRASSQAMNSLNPGRHIHYVFSYRHYQALSACGRKTEALQVLAVTIRGLNSLIDSLQMKELSSNFVDQRTEISGVKCLPLQNEILMTWESLQPKILLISLPRRHGSKPVLTVTNSDPGGSEVQVRWTVWIPEDEELSNKVERRRQQLHRLLEEAEQYGAAPAQKHLAEALGVSQRTIAQDLVEVKYLKHLVNIP